MIRRYQKGDAQSLAVQVAQTEEAQFFADEFQHIFAYTLCDEKAVYAVFGWRYGEDEKTAECFALVSGAIGIKLLELVRFLEKEIPSKMALHLVDCLIITVKKNFVAGRRLAELLGFSLVADLPQFFLGEDYQLFERKK